MLVLRNHGLLAPGRNVAEAFSLTYHFERSAEAQLKIQAAAGSGQKVVVPTETPLKKTGGRWLVNYWVPRAAPAIPNARG